MAEAILATSPGLAWPRRQSSHYFDANFMTETAELADVVLPVGSVPGACTPLYRPDVYG